MRATSDAAIEAEVESAATSFTPATINDSKNIAIAAVIAHQPPLGAGPGVDRRLAAGARAVGRLLVTRRLDRRVTSHVVAPAIAIGAGFGSATSVAVGLSLSRNDNHNDVQAFIDHVTQARRPAAR